MEYKEVHIQCAQDLIEILVAELDFAGADSLSELDEGVVAAFDISQFDEAQVEEICSRYGLAFEVKTPVKKNWNEEWEKNFEPLMIRNCSVRASFHPKPDHCDIDVVIDPRMSFGTGHHETTSLMVDYFLDMDFNGRSVMDMGTGTGILAILASKMGAKTIVGIDNDDWAVDNAKDNLELNGQQKVEILSGDSELLSKFGNFDIFIANINRNILLSDMAIYADHIVKEGKLLLSGFYLEDIPVLKAKAEESGLEYVETKSKNNWALVEFRKK